MAFAEWAASFITWSNEVIGVWGYLGIFLVSLIGNASIILPVPSFIIVFTFGAILNPWLVGIVGAAGATIGELTGYFLGRGGRRALRKKYGKQIRMAEKWIEKYSIFLVIVVFSATPLPSDVAGALAGVVKYDMRKFLLATFMGRTIAYLILAFAGFYGLNYVLGLFGGG
jgi:membrane protein DedA with SNARE-associated domain